jgi:arabinofuranosyltransferase
VSEAQVPVSSADSGRGAEDRQGKREAPGAHWLPGFFLSAVVFLLLAARLDFLCDDAFISFRYARHLAEGKGLVFNPAREIPVEGYSNFLWVVYLALCSSLGLSIPLMSKVGAVLCGLALLAHVHHMAANELRLSRVGTAACGLFVASLPPVALWATGGLAALPMTLAIFAAYRALLHSKAGATGVRAGIWLAVACLMRADGMVWAAMLLASGGLLWLLEGRPAQRLRPLLLAAGIVAVVVGSHFGWRYSYYGDWLPNTARVKAGFSWSRLDRGLDYVVAWLLLLPSVSLLLLLAARRPARATLNLWLPATTVILGSLAYAIWVGGDFMPFGRFLMPVIPFLAIPFASAWARGESRAQSVSLLGTGTLIALSVLACLDVNVVPRSTLESFHFRRDRSFQTEIERRDDMARNTRKWTWIGRALGEHTDASESIILGGIGAASFYSELFVYDLYGLVTPEVLERGEVRENASPGHDRRVNEPVFFEDEPTYLRAILGYVGDGEWPWWADRLPGNWETHPFRKTVRDVHIPLSAADGFPADSELILFRFHWADAQ